jgi:DNA-binding GntR family transcriptional regulator
MILPTQAFDDLLYLASEIESGDYFDQNVKEFIQLSKQLKHRVYRYTKDPDILEMADQIPTIELQPYRRSFLEQMLPKSGRDMVGTYKTREMIRAKVRETVARFKEIRRWAGED